MTGYEALGKRIMCACWVLGTPRWFLCLRFMTPLGLQELGSHDMPSEQLPQCLQFISYELRCNDQRCETRVFEPSSLHPKESSVTGPSSFAGTQWTRMHSTYVLVKLVNELCLD